MTIKVGLLGLGTVGTGVIRIVQRHQEDLQRQTGMSISIEKVLVQNLYKDRAVPIDADKLTDNPADIINNPDIQVVIEVMGGIDPAKAYVLEAIARGKHVITANKDLMALHGQEIMSRAAESGCDVFYEASVAGGIPIIRTLTESFSSDRICKVMGIVNGTTNYILTKMSKEGADYQEVLKEAQQLGYAEADPSSDVEGLDAARKMTILATLSFRTNVSLSDVTVKGITNVTKQDIAYGKRLGYEMKLLGIAESQHDRISVSVEPTMVKSTHPLASVNGVFNAIYVYGETVGETMFYGAGAGELPTATSIVADLVGVVKNHRLGVNGRTASLAYKVKQLKTDDEICSKYYILLQVADKAGVLASITQVLAENGVSLESVNQQPNNSNPLAEIIIITHLASCAAINRVLEMFSQLQVVQQIKSVYRVEG